MLRSIITSLCAIISLTAQANEVADTIVNVNNAHSVVFTQSDSLISVNIKGKDADSTYTFNYIGGRPRINAYTIASEHANNTHQGQETSEGKTSRCSKNSELRFGGFSLGFVNTLCAPANFKTDMASSIEMMLEPLSFRWYTPSRKLFFSMGFSLDWRNYSLTNRTRFLKDEQKNIIISTYPEEASDTKRSRIKTFSIGIPFRFGTNLGRGFTADIAAILNFNTYASILSLYEVKDNEMIPGQTVTHHIKDFDKNIHQQKVTVDFMAQLHWRFIGVYAKYSPCHVLNTNYAPKFTPLSFGLSIFY